MKNIFEMFFGVFRNIFVILCYDCLKRLYVQIIIWKFKTNRFTFAVRVQESSFTSCWVNLNSKSRNQRQLLLRTTGSFSYFPFSNWFSLTAQVFLKCIQIFHLMCWKLFGSIGNDGNRGKLMFGIKSGESV